MAAPTICVILCNLSVCKLITQKDKEERSFIDIEQLEALENKASGLAFFYPEEPGIPIMLPLKRERIWEPVEGWPELLYIIKPGFKVTKLKEQGKIDLETEVVELKKKVGTLETEVEKLKKLTGELKGKKAQYNNLSRTRFHELCSLYERTDLLQGNNYSEWKKSGGAESFFYFQADKSSTSNGRYHDTGYGGGSYYHSNNNHHSYYGN